jgi:hypothetical protein
MIEFIIANFYPIAGAISLACFVGYIGWRNNFKVRQANAAATFRAAFADTLSALRNTNSDPADILIEAFPAHEIAVNEFGVFLCFSRKAFHRAWNQYAYHETTGIQFLEQYSSAGCSISEAKQRREFAIKRLEHLLSYANQS